MLDLDVHSFLSAVGLVTRWTEVRSPQRFIVGGGLEVRGVLESKTKN